MTVVRAAITQTSWTGDKESMIQRHEQFARDAAAQHAQVICFQELFFGPYFGIIQDPKYYEYAEPVPGPTTERFQRLAAELKLVMIVPLYEEEQPGIYYNTAVVIDADGNYLGKYRKHHIPNLPQFWEKFYFRPGNLGYPVFDTAVGKVGVYICYDRHSPEGWRELGLGGAELVFNPSATKPGLSNRLWELEQPAAAAANQYFIAAINRVGAETGEFGDEAVNFYGSSYFVDPRGNYVGDVASTENSELVIRDLDLDLVREVRNAWQFYRDRRPETYTATVAP
jgi:beta-ureidopropionase